MQGKGEEEEVRLAERGGEEVRPGKGDELVVRPVEREGEEVRPGKGEEEEVRPAEGEVEMVRPVVDACQEVGRVEMGTSPIPAPEPCALMCLIHTGTMQTPINTWRLLAEGLDRSRITYQEVSTAVTPVGTECASTCVTPVNLAEKAINTSASEGASTEMMDSAVLTDSLLWNFSREALESVPREDLERRLETSLLINEVLSGQLKDLSKSKNLGLWAGPADQRDTFTQTDSSQTPEVEDHYRSLYLQHASRVQELEQTLEQCLQLHSAICNSRKQQNLLIVEVEECLAGADGAYEDMKNTRLTVQEQLKGARNLARQSTVQLQAMTRVTAKALEEKTVLKKTADEAEWKMVNMQQELEQTAYELHGALDKVKRLECENLQLKSGLEILTSQLAKVEEERDKLMKDNSKYFVELATTEASLKLSEAALAERAEKLQTCEAQNKELSDTLTANVKSLEEATDKLKQEKEALELSEAEVTRLTKALALKDEELQELSDTRAEAALIADYNKFMEQELKVSREHLLEMEGQLSEHVRLLHDRNLQCEELRAKCEECQRNLDTVKEDARGMLLEMGQQMNQATVEISALKAQIQEVIKSAGATIKNWHQNHPVAVAKTNQLLPGNQAQEETAKEVKESAKASEEHHEGPLCNIRSDQSAFAPISSTMLNSPECNKVAPLDIESCPGLNSCEGTITPKKLETEDTLLPTVAELRESTQKLLEVIQMRVKDLQEEISTMREQRRATFSKNWSELSSLQNKVLTLETENRRLNRDLQVHVKTNSELKNAVSLQDETILEFNKQMETNLKEHTEFLAMKEEVTGLKRQLQRSECETETCREELTKLQTSGGVLNTNWLEEKVELHYQVRKLREAYVQKDIDMQELKVKMYNHKTILEENYQKAEAELAKLDDLIEHVRLVLLSVPNVVASSVELRSLLIYLGEDIEA
ncbi:sperm-associated antigen 5 [Chiloscyllium punctatum]|uniref:sperm-associated antigen 5 n=1 Tax=Chiloscyllium punctatum TaxID=137246 RepID=UPI003B640B08